MGSNAFGMETFNGSRKHAMEHYVDLCEAGAIDLSFLVTHRFALDDWRDAFKTAMHKKTGCIKVAFSFPARDLSPGMSPG